MLISPPSLSPVTAKSTSLESTAKKLAWDPYCLTPIGTIGPCYLSCLLGSKTSFTMLSIISMTASRSFLTESSFHSNALTVCLTWTETISWNFSSSSVCPSPLFTAVEDEEVLFAAGNYYYCFALFCYDSNLLGDDEFFWFDKCEASETDGLSLDSSKADCWLMDCYISLR